MDQATGFFIEHLPIQPFFDEHSAESVAVGQPYHHRRRRIRSVHEPLSEVFTSQFITHSQQ
jgi:hypothetical protein